MKKEKNIDQFLENMDQLLEIDKNTPNIDLDKASKKYHEKILNERKGISKRITLAILLGILLFLITPNLFARINIVVIDLFLLISFGLSYRAQKEINSQNLATSFNEFKTQQKEIALSNLKLIKRIRISFYAIFTWALLSYSYDYISEPDNIKLVAYIISFTLGFYLTSSAMENLVKEHEERVKALN